MADLSFDTKLEGTAKVRVGDKVRVAVEMHGKVEGKEENDLLFYHTSQKKIWRISENSLLAINGLSEMGNSYGLADRIRDAKSAILNFSVQLGQIMGDDQSNSPLLSSAHSPNVAQHVTKKNLACMEDLERDLQTQTKTIIQLQSQVKKLEEENENYKKDSSEKLKEAEKRIKDLEAQKKLAEKEAEAQKKEAEKQIKKLQATVDGLDKKLNKQATKEQKSVSPSPSPPPQRPVTIHYDASQQFPMVDDVESCLVQAQQITLYQFKHVTKDNSPCNLLLYFDIVDDRIRTVEAKKEFAKSLLAKTNNNCVWVFVCFKPSHNEEGTKITSSIKGLASGLTLPSGQFAQVYLTAEYQVRSNQRDKQGNFLHVIVNKEDFKQKILSLVNMKVTGAPANLPGITIEPMPVAPPMPAVPLNPVLMPSSMDLVPIPPSTTQPPSHSVPTPFTQANMRANPTYNEAQNHTTALVPVNSTNSEVDTQQVQQHSAADSNQKIASPRHQGSNGTIVTLLLANGKSIQLLVKEVTEPVAPIANVQTGHTRSISSGTASLAVSVEPTESNETLLEEAKKHGDIANMIIQRVEQEHYASRTKTPSTEESNVVTISLLEDFPSTLQQIAPRLTKGKIADPSKLIIEAKNIHEDWVLIASDAELQAVPSQIGLPTTEFRATEKMNEENMDTSTSEPGPDAVTESGSVPETSK